MTSESHSKTTSYGTIRAHRRDIAARTQERYPRHIAVLVESVSLMVDATEIIEARVVQADHHTPDGASQAAVWRFLSTLPSTVSWCMEAAASGDYLIAKNLLRLVLEEAVKLTFYAQHPDEALRQVEGGKDRDYVELSQMLRHTTQERAQGLLRLHGQLSSLYSHANFNIPPELLFTGSSGRPTIGGGPRFEPALFEPIALQTIILAANALYALSARFPVLIEDPGWLARFEHFSQDAAVLMPNDES